MHHPTKLPGYAHSPMTARQPPPERSLLQATRLITYQPGMVRLESPEPSSPVEKYRKSASHNIGKLPPFRGGEGQHLSKIGGSPPLGGGSHSCLLVKQPAFPPRFAYAHTLTRWPGLISSCASRHPQRPTKLIPPTTSMGRRPSRVQSSAVAQPVGRPKT